LAVNEVKRSLAESKGSRSEQVDEENPDNQLIYCLQNGC